MTRISAIRARYVDGIPSAIEEGVLYVSTAYGTAVHKCCCGCGQEVVTPLGPTDWSVTAQGNTVSVYPSIGNWSFACRSHYWIRNGQILWAEQWSEEMIRYGRSRDRMAKRVQYGELGAGRKPGFWAWLWRFLTGK
ncbi:MAG: DUF6527 family protein [Gammaproteobacteria bacterium]|nr:DUF6527 family protein [Gammaproteobacteria bacterium]